MNITFSEAKFGSSLYSEAVKLRSLVLREPLGLHFTQEDLEDEKDQVHIVAEFKNEVVGVVLLKKLSVNKVKLRQFAVHPNWQAQGIGMKMLQYFEQVARSLNANQVEMHARLNAINFYTKSGYQKEGSIFEEVGIPHYKMTKRIV